ncbi:rRNA adenine N-6-methyltransferase family protein [Psychroserpens sp. SPM9]|uniref:THUMP-like domain-containing protein n=1 Tax=Psychroserpens sp. SPM9 TaxID=2975598 RepID=UPI0021A4DEAA|nr:rRNA adenine N-6-methyltransferase family protein [Psychroserpens sp. SPM9]MDG5491535.1 rRNA adenine N-6-methyltransferase family protein [Psychroserpens sp. SPM9]
MNTKLLNSDIQAFIGLNLKSDISKILLKGTTFEDVSTSDIVAQIEAKAKCKTKLPTWFLTEGIYYPNKLNIEQTSSEIAALYKSELLKGTSIIDVTGGFGVDSYYFSKVFKNVTHCEINTELSQIVTHNNTKLGVENIQMIADDGIDYITSTKQDYDWIYIDPSRRHDQKGKVFFLKDCEPNVPNHLDDLLKVSKNIAIKTSPLLDLSVGISELKHVKEIHIIAIKNEVKELLWIIENGFNSEITIKTVNIIEGDKDEFSYKLEDESKAIVTFDDPQNYLYEPNSAILKSGGFNILAEQLNLIKLHQHSHLYTSSKLIDFPGRTFKIESIIDYNKKNLKALKITKANMTIRNFPESVQNLRKKYRIKDGGKEYLFFTTNHCNEKILIVCSKLN